MRIVDLHYCVRKRPPAGAMHIGRATKGLRASVLANPYIPESIAPKPCKHAVALPDDRVLERYGRHLTMNVVKEGFHELGALRELRSSSVLACWCVEREAVLVGRGRKPPEKPCHGDVVYTVWAALERRGWQLQLVDFQRDLDRANAAWSELYEQAFGEPMRWGSREEQERG